MAWLRVGSGFMTKRSSSVVIVLTGPESSNKAAAQMGQIQNTVTSSQ